MTNFISDDLAVSRWSLPWHVFDSVAKACSSRAHRFTGLATLAIVLASTSACTVTLIAPYDEVTNSALASIQKDAEQFFVAVQRELYGVTSPATLSKYDKKHTDFFDGAKVSLATLDIRTRALSKNTRTQKEVAALKDEFAAFELHDQQQGGLTAGDILGEQLTMEAHFRSLTTLEIAKKPGSSSTKGN